VPFLLSKALTDQLRERYNESMIKLTLQQAEQFVDNCPDAEWFGWEIGLITRTPKGTFRKLIAAREGLFSVGNEYAGFLKKPGD
jgi:hypothetical protein